MKHAAKVALLVMSLAVAATAEEKSAAPATATVGAAAPTFSLTDASGKTHNLADYKGKYVVLEWVNFGCPFVRKHYDSQNMQTLQADWTKKDVVWLSICSSAKSKQGYFEGEELTKQLTAEKVAATAYLLDTDGSVGKAYGAKTTPNMYVIDPNGVLIYAGAIDDIPSPKPADIPKSVNYVKSALESAMAGKEVAVKTTQPYGCSVKY